MYIGFLSVEALRGAVVSLLQWVGKVISAAMFFVVFCALIGPILPDDPFRGAIVEAAQLFAQYSKWINLVIPIPYLITSTLFAVSFRYFIFAYKKLGGVLLDHNGQTFFSI